jgi:mono/diheme cytochrome c family protein
MNKAVTFSLAVVVAGLTACGGDSPQPATTADQPAAPAQQPAMAVDLPDGVTQEMVAEGRQLYGTVCAACHGQGGVGGPLGPSLMDQDWIHIDGSYESIVQNIISGVPQPVQYPAPMPAMGGGNFTQDQVRSIAAYVYTLSHGG